MKKTLFAIALAAVALAFSACTKEFNYEIANGTSVIRAYTESHPQTRTTLSGDDASGYKVLWATGDEILFDKVYTYQLSGGAGTTEGEFTGSGTFSAGTPYEAIYPADRYSSLNETYVWPSNQDGSIKSAPMFASGDAEGTDTPELHFKNLGGVLRLTLKSDEAVTLSTVTLSANEALSGNMTVTPVGDVYSVSLDSGNSYKYIEISSGEGFSITAGGSKDFFFAIPAGTYTGVKVEMRSSSGSICSYTLKSSLSIERSKIATASLNCKMRPADSLNGLFSVSDDLQVYFSKGNLQAAYYGTSYTWGFAANQYDYVGKALGNTTIGSQTSGAVVDLFGWSTSATNFGINTSTSSSDYSGDFKDWGTAIDGNGTWRTLSTAEWQYLINKNNDETIRKGKYKYGVTVCEKANCLILAPDDFTGTIETSYNAAAWATAEAAGLVCLPAAGYRDGSSVFDVGDGGYYWSSSAGDGNYAYYVSFDSSSVNPDYYDYRRSGDSVRLITECQ